LFFPKVAHEWISHVHGQESTTQQGFPSQVVHPLWEGVLIAGDGDVTGSTQLEFVLAHRAFKQPIPRELFVTKMILGQILIEIWLKLWLAFT
jgi:hypothetical protein